MHVLLAGFLEQRGCALEEASGGPPVPLFLVQGPTCKPSQGYWKSPMVFLSACSRSLSLRLQLPFSYIIQDRCGQFPLVLIHWFLFKENSLVFSPRKDSNSIQFQPFILMLN